MSETDNRIEERLAHLMAQLEDLSDVVARQDREIAELRARVTLLMRRAAESDSDQSGAHLYADERPPHY